MGCLARFHRILVGLKVVSEEEGEKVVDDVKFGTKVDGAGEDLGEKIVRDQPPRGEIDESIQTTEVQETKTVEGQASKPKKRKQEIEAVEKKSAKFSNSTPPNPPKKRKKKGGDAFDDLFASLM